MTPLPKKSSDRFRRIVTPLLALVTASLCSAQTAAPAKATETTKDEDVLVLTPFSVTADRDSGYYAQNTLAGTRLNTSVADLASSITVVTKQQMVDTASIDINDVFMYEAGTEGSNTYTQTDVSRNGIPRDTIAGYSADNGDSSTRATANRVRGLATADPSQNNYPAISRIPFDSYNTNSLEISRGPNSLIFGTGSPSGIVNQSTAQAVLNQTQTHVEARLGSWNDQRVSFSHNQTVIKDKMAVYLAGLWSDTGFRRKPSDNITRRQYIAMTLRPFSKTQITASYEHYDQFNNSPNSQTPRDYVTPWLQAGRPAYDPVARTVKRMDTGAVTGPYVISTLSPGFVSATATPAANTALTSSTSPQYVPGIQFGIAGSNRITMFQTPNGIIQVNPVQAVQFTTLLAPNLAYNAPADSARTAAQREFADRRLTSSAGPVAPTGVGSWIQPSSTDKAIYDYEHINLLQMNYGMYEGKTYNLELQQQILPNLFLSLGWFRQNLKADENYTVSNANAITTLYVDTNLKNIDGTTNTHFGNVFLADIAPDKFLTPESAESFRAMMAYELDFTKKKGFAHWFGRHRLLGLVSSQNNQRNTFRYRYAFNGGDYRLQANPALANSVVANANFTRLHYIGANDKGVVDFAPGLLKNPNDGGPSTANASFYNWTTGAWDSAPIQMSQMLFYAGKYGLEEKHINSKSAALTSYFWDDRIVTTVGMRKDNYKARNTNTAGRTATNTGLGTDNYIQGLAIDPAWTQETLTNWFRLAGTTKTLGGVFRVVRWNGGEFSVHFNKSDNFNPPPGVPVDFFGVPLPKSTGEGKDYGIGVSMFDNKLVASLNWFDSSNNNAVTTAGSAAVGRVTRMDTANFRSWADYVVRIRTNLGGEANMDANRNLLDPNFGNNSAAGHALTAQMKTEIAALMSAPAYDNWPPSGISGTQSNQAKGIEFQMTYNPIKNWTIKATATKVHSTYSEVIPEVDAWLGDANTAGSRLYIWQKAAATDIADFTLQGGTPVKVSSFWDGYGFNADAKLSNATGITPTWTSVKGFYDSAVAPEIVSAKALQGKAASNEREWSFNVLSNYSFQKGKLKGVGVGGAVRWAGQAVAGYYGDPAKRDSAGLLNAPDLLRPIYTPSETHLDLWVSYSRKVFSDKIRWTVRLNVRDALENGKLLPVAYNYDGSAYAYRIVDPRQFFLSSAFDF